MSDLKLEDHYKVELNAVKGLYHYPSCRTENIPLFGHQVLPQGFYYTKPRLSPDCKYVSIIAKGKVEDKIFIWSLDNIDGYLYSYTSKTIENFTFSPDSKYFYIFYKNEPPVKYEIKSGKEVLSLEILGEQMTRMICCSFSKDGKNIYVGTKTHFILWNTSNGKLQKKMKEESSVKTMRNDWQLSIRDNLDAVIFSKFESKLITFKIPNATIPQEILSCIISPDLSYLYYSNLKGIFRYKLNKKGGGLDELVKFNEEEDTTKVLIDENCESALSTDMLNINIYKLNVDNSDNNIYKEKFSDITINQNKKLIVTVDDLCINITYYGDEEKEEVERFIWLNENPSKFLFFTFSPDFHVILATLDENNAISYNTQTGRVIKKWRNMEDDWSMACEMAPETSQIAVIATKSDKNTIKIWDYNNGNEVLSLFGYHAHSFSFSSDGKLLACGAREGDEVARLWDLTDNSYISYNFKGINNNLYTIVNLTDNLDEMENKRIILASIGQEPIVFDANSKKLLYKCKCPFSFEKIQGIQSNIKYNCFVIKGRDTKKKNMALLYRLNDGKLLQVFEDCWNIDLAKHENFIISRSSNINSGNLTISNIQDLNKIEHKNCQLQAETSSFLQDYKSIVSAFGDEKNLNFIISEVNNGKMIAEIKYTQNYDRHAEVDLSVNKDENVLVLRYIEFVEPIEI
jgi:WD40 repeat protein